jgi:hypothetical protein
MFEDMMYNTKYQILEQGKNDEELKDIGEKFGIDLPSPDLAVFRGRYASIGVANKNHCTLPRLEVERALTTLKGKAVDINHLRKKTIGYFLGAEIEGDDIISYGVFWKSNYAEEYEEFKKQMDQEKICMSFESWGTRNYKNDKDYDLQDIHFAGGAFLTTDTAPAFPNAEVLEFSAKPNRILEFAKVIDENEELAKDNEKIVFPSTDPKVNDKKDHFPCKDADQARNALARVAQYSTAPKWYDGPLSEVVERVKTMVQKEYPSIEVSEALPELARFYVWDMENIMRSIYEVECLGCEEKMLEVDSIDFKNNQASIHCLSCDSQMNVDLTPVAKLSKQGRKIKQVSKSNHDSVNVFSL